MPKSGSRTRRYERVPALVTAVMLLAVLGLSACNGSSGSSDKPSGTGSGSTAIDPGTLNWVRSPAGAPGVGNFGGIASDGTTFVVVGRAASNAGPIVPIWTSTDGYTWKSPSVSKSVIPANTIVSDVVWDGTRFIAFGYPLSGATETLAWTSPDGRTWKRYTSNGFPPEPNRIPVAASATKDGLLLVTGNPASGTFAIWRLGNDQWRALGPVPGGITSNARVVRALPGLEGAPGLVAGGDRGLDAAAWTSSNGDAWNPATISGLDPVKFESIQDLVSGGPGFVAVGVGPGPTGDEDAAVWTSRNGTQWRPVAPDPTVLGGQGAQGMDGATLSGTSVLTVGHSGPAAAVWSSTNGRTWSRAPDVPAFQVQNGTAAGGVGITTGNGRVVIIFREQRYNATTRSFDLVGLGIVTGRPSR